VTNPLRSIVGGANVRQNFCVVALEPLIPIQSPRKDVTISKDDQTADVDCGDGDNVTIRSNDNKITIKGDCRKLTVSGDDNIVNAAMAREVQISGDDNKMAVNTVGKLTLTGDDNIVSWKTAPQLAVERAHSSEHGKLQGLGCGVSVPM
jgi:hypothetical protein